MHIAPADFGTLCHDAVEFAIEKGQAEGFDAGTLIEAGIGNGAAAEAIDQAVSYARGFIDSPFWKRVRHYPTIQTEKPFLYSLGNLVIDGRMDLFIESDDEIFIIDFKSDFMLDPQRYAIQLQIYRNAASGFRPGKRISTGLYDLGKGDLHWCETAVPEWLLESMAASAAKASGGQLDMDYSDSV